MRGRALTADGTASRVLVFLSGKRSGGGPGLGHRLQTEGLLIGAAHTVFCGFLGVLFFPNLKKKTNVDFVPNLYKFEGFT